MERYKLYTHEVGAAHTARDDNGEWVTYDDAANAIAAEKQRSEEWKERAQAVPGSADVVGRIAALEEQIEKERIKTEREKQRADDATRAYGKVADAIAPTSASADELAELARATRQERDRYQSVFSEVAQVLTDAGAKGHHLAALVFDLRDQRDELATKLAERERELLATRELWMKADAAHDEIAALKEKLAASEAACGQWKSFAEASVKRAEKAEAEIRRAWTALESAGESRVDCEELAVTIACLSRAHRQAEAALSEARERIEALEQVASGNEERLDLLVKKYNGGLSKEENCRLAALQELIGQAFPRTAPAQPVSEVDELSIVELPYAGPIDALCTVPENLGEPAKDERAWCSVDRTFDTCDAEADRQKDEAPECKHCGERTCESIECRECVCCHPEWDEAKQGGFTMNEYSAASPEQREKMCADLVDAAKQEARAAVVWSEDEAKTYPAKQERWCECGDSLGDDEPDKCHTCQLIERIAKEAKQEPAPKSIYGDLGYVPKLRPAPKVCKTCGDTHKAWSAARGRWENCTRCPTPCPKCRKDGIGAYCEKAPCSCKCHDKRAKESTESESAARTEQSKGMQRSLGGEFKPTSQTLTAQPHHSPSPFQPTPQAPLTDDRREIERAADSMTRPYEIGPDFKAALEAKREAETVSVSRERASAARYVRFESRNQVHCECARKVLAQIANELDELEAAESEATRG